MRRLWGFLVWLSLCVPAAAGTSTITVLDGNGNPHTYQVFVNPSSSFLGSIVACDPTATANCIGVNGLGQQTVIVTSTQAIEPPVGQPNDTAAISGTASGSVISILKGILTNVITPISVSGSFAVSSPLGVNIAQTTPINVTVGTSPVQTTLPASPIGVAIVSSPVNVTGSLSTVQTGQNIVQLANQTLASPTTYGIAPVGSTQGVNAFITNNVSVTPPTPLGVTLPASPISVGIAGPTPLAVTLASPVSVGIAGPTPLNVTLVAIPGSPQAMTLSAGQVYLSQQAASTVIGYSATPLSALASSPGTLVVSGPHQLARVYCALRAPATITTSVYLRLYDSTSTQLATGTQRGFLLIAANGAAPATGISAQITTVPPGEQYSNGIVAIIATTGMGTIFGTGTSQTTETVDCNIAYN